MGGSWLNTIPRAMSRGMRAVSQPPPMQGGEGALSWGNNHLASTASPGQAGGGPWLILLPLHIDSYVEGRRKNDTRMAIASRDNLGRFLSPA